MNTLTLTIAENEKVKVITEHSLYSFCLGLYWAASMNESQEKSKMNDKIVNNRVDSSDTKYNRKAELLNCSKDGTFVMKFYEDGLAEKAEEYIKKDSPIDEHEVIVCNDIIAVCTNSIGRSTGLADELMNLFNHGNIYKITENDKFETLGDAYAKYPQSTLVMRKQYVDEKDETIADLQKTNATIANNAVTMNHKHQSLTKAWCGMCNYFMSISENGGCEKCPFKDSELCYDANEECDYDKFEELIKGIKINGEK